MYSRKLILFSLFFVCATALAQEPFKKPYESYKLSCANGAGKLILSTPSDPKSFNPIIAQETSTTAVTSMIFEGLVRTDPLTLEVKPNLAVKWEVKNDGREWIFYLRDGVYFSDGIKFSADDVLFTFNDLIFNDDIPNSSADILTIDGKKIIVEKIDDLTVRFKLPYDFGPFLRAMGQEILPKHKYLAAVREKRFTFALGLDADLKDIVGTGPFRLEKYLPGERIVFGRNPQYWKKDNCGNSLPYLKNIIYLIVPSEDTALLKFLEGELDYYTLRPQDLAMLGPDQKKRAFTIYNAGPGFGQNFIVFNQNPSFNPKSKKLFVEDFKLRWFKDVNFRRALAYALNKEKMITVLFNGLGFEQNSPVDEANKFFYNKNITHYDYDPTRSRELLLASGFFDRNGDGFLEDKVGNRVELNMFTNANNPLRVQMGSLIKQDFGTVGVKVNFLPLDFNNLVSKLNATYDWDLILIGLTSGIEPHFGKNVWSYKGSLHMWNPSGKAIAPYEEEIERLFNAAAKTSNAQKRKRLYDRWQAIAAGEVPLIFTAGQYSLYAVRNKFGNVFPTVYGGVFGEIEYVYDKAIEHAR
jgi:peptide/nickel transport system substrate-binding protein